MLLRCSTCGLVPCSAEKSWRPQRQLRQPFFHSSFAPQPPPPPPPPSQHSVHTRSQVLTDTKGTCKVSEDAVAASERQNSTGGKGVSTPSPAGLHKAIESAPKDVTKTEQAQQSSERKLTKSVGKAASVRARAKRCALTLKRAQMKNPRAAHEERLRKRSERLQLPLVPSANEEPPCCT